jgi:glutathione S-transferase
LALARIARASRAKAKRYRGPNAHAALSIGWEEKMKLYEWDFAPNCRRVRMFLLEKGIDILKEECITPEIALKAPYLVMYKHAMVPMLELDDGTQIGEALSIWTYLETLHPDPPLMGTTAVEKAVISAWERRAYDEGMVGHAEIFPMQRSSAIPTPNSSTAAYLATGRPCRRYRL